MKLDLLRILPPLADTGSVTQAAQQLGLSQSGLSSALARLRVQLHDPLFVQTTAGMSPTPLAAQLIVTVRELIDRVDEDIARVETLSPDMLDRQFVLAMGDAGESELLARLIQRITAAHPRASVRTLALSPDELTAGLESGQVDLALGYNPELTQHPILQQTLFEQTFACIVATGHDIVGEELSRADFERYSHASVTAASRSIQLFETFLKQQEIKHRVVLRTPHLLSLPFIVEETGLIATVPLSLAEQVARDKRIRVLRLSFQPPVFAVCQYWHRRFNRQPRNRWLRSYVSALSKERPFWAERIAYYGGK